MASIFGTKLGKGIETVPTKKLKLTEEQKLLGFCAVFMTLPFVFTLVLGAGCYLKQKNGGKAKEQVEKQVKTYEKSLPGYLEQKQLFEQYRDSLTNSKIRQ